MGSPYGIQAGCLSKEVMDLGSSCRGLTLPPQVGWSASELNCRELENIVEKNKIPNPTEELKMLRNPHKICKLFQILQLQSQTF